MSGEVHKRIRTHSDRNNVNNLGKFDLLLLYTDQVDTIYFPSKIKNPIKAEIFTMVTL